MVFMILLINFFINLHFLCYHTFYLILKILNINIHQDDNIFQKNSFDKKLFLTLLHVTKYDIFKEQHYSVYFIKLFEFVYWFILI